MIITIGYLAEIAVLVFCIYMTWRIRRVINGLGRGLIPLFAFLIIQRLDFAFDIYDENISFILSIAVVAAITYELYQIYKMLPIYMMYFENRQRKINELNESWEAEQERMRRGYRYS